MPTDKPLSALRCERIVTVFVGPNAWEWVLHEDTLLPMSRFFRAAFHSPFKEGQDGILRLPEDDHRAFKLFVGYIYSHAINGLNETQRDPLPPPDGLKITIRDYLSLYVFASKYMIEPLENEVIDLIFDYYAANSADHELDPMDAEFAYERTPEDSKLRRLLTQFAVRKIMSDKQHPSQGREYILRHASDFTRDKVLLISQYSPLSCKSFPPAEPTKCEFHSHPPGQSCDLA